MPTLARFSTEKFWPNFWLSLRLMTRAVRSAEAPGEKRQQHKEGERRDVAPHAAAVAERDHQRQGKHGGKRDRRMDGRERLGIEPALLLPAGAECRDRVRRVGLERPDRMPGIGNEA